MDVVEAGKDAHKDVKDPAAVAQAQDHQSTFDIVNCGYWDVMRQHHWADFVRSPGEELRDASFFFAPRAVVRGVCNKGAMYLLEPTVVGGLAGMTVGAGVGGSFLAAEKTLGSVLPVFSKPANFIRSGMMCGKTSVISETAYAGATAAAIDYGISMAADRWFGVNSPVAKVLAPNMIGTALETKALQQSRS